MQMPQELGGICARLTQDLPLDRLQCGVGYWAISSVWRPCQARQQQPCPSRAWPPPLPTYIHQQADVYSPSDGRIFTNKRTYIHQQTDVYSPTNGFIHQQMDRRTYIRQQTDRRTYIQQRTDVYSDLVKVVSSVHVLPEHGHLLLRQLDALPLQHLQHDLGCYVTKYAHHQAFKSIAQGKLTFDERVVPHRVGYPLPSARCPASSTPALPFFLEDYHHIIHRRI